MSVMFCLLIYFFLAKQYKLKWLQTLRDRRMHWITNNCHVLPQESPI